MKVVFPRWKVITEFMKVFCGAFSTLEKLPLYKKPGFENKLKLVTPFKSKPLNLRTTPFFDFESPLAAYKLTDTNNTTPSRLNLSALVILLKVCVYFTK